jgi:cytochrome c biogenesis protein CcdA
MTLSLPEALRSRIRLTISKRARMGLTIGATLVLGAVVAFFEAPCTGQVYLPTIVFALQHLPQYAWGPVGWLLLYNLCFIAPLVVIFAAVMFGLTSERLTGFFRRHLAKAKFAMAAFFFLLGALMVVYLVRG